MKSRYLMELRTFEIVQNDLHSVKVKLLNIQNVDGESLYRIIEKIDEAIHKAWLADNIERQKEIDKSIEEESDARDTRTVS